MSQLESKLKSYAENNLNVLLIGGMGIGKTSLANAVAKTLGLTMQYYSASTLDPWADIVGIPVPDKNTGTLDFYRPKKLQDAQFLFFDELNRAHPRVLNAILEIIQFKSVNGEKLPNLKMVWAAINPPGGDYQVEDLDPALVDRFHCYINMKAAIPLEYMKSVISEPVVRALFDWWTQDLNEKQREHLSPRRLEYIGLMIDKGVHWRDAIPQGTTFPVSELNTKIQAISKSTYDNVVITKEDILANTDKYIKKLKDDNGFAIKLNDYINDFKIEQIFQIRDVVELMPQEMIKNLAKRFFRTKKNELKNEFVSHNIDLKNYPKLSSAFEWS